MHAAPDYSRKLKPKCGMCGSRDLRASYPRLWDYLVARFRYFEVLRCRACRHRSRFYFSDSVQA